MRRDLARLLAGLAALAACPATPQTTALKGYVFREADGAPPRRRLTIELAQQGKVRRRQTTRPDGGFEFSGIAAGRYTLAPRFGAFTFTQDSVVVSGAGPNFAAIMLPKRRAGVAQFGTVSVEQLNRRNNRRIRTKLQKADRLVKTADLAGAAKCYEEVLETSPSAEIFDALAVLYLQQGHKCEAYQAFEKAITQDPKFLFPYAHLAAVYLDEGKHQEAASVAARALLIDTNWASAHVLMGEARLRLGDLDAAGRHAKAADQLAQGKSPEPYLLWAKISWAGKDCAKTRNQLNRYLELRTSARAFGEFRSFVEAVRACP